VGQILGPLLGGVIAAGLGLEWPFFLFAIPTLVFVVMSLRLREPVRGYHERKAAGLDDEAALVADRPEGPWATMKVLHQVRTIRRIWCATPFLGIALFGVISLINLVYEDVFGLDSAARGVIAAGAEPFQIIGVFFAMPRIARIAMSDPGFLLRFVALVGVVDGFVLVALAFAPHVSIAIAMHFILAASIGTLAPAFFALISIVAPPRVRAASFSTISVFAIPGIAVFLPLIGQVSDSTSLQTSMVLLVPIAIAAGFILRSAAPFVMDDILMANAPAADPEERAQELSEELAEADTFDAPHG